MLKRDWMLIAFVYLALAEVLSLAPVPDLSSCLIQPEHSEQSTNHDDKKYCPAFHVGIIASIDAVDGFLEHHDKSVVGGFTIVLAISTIGLWLATNKLWEAGERQFELLAKSYAAQSRDMRASIRAATDGVWQSSRSNQIATSTAHQDLRAYVTAKEVNLTTHRGLPWMTLNGPIDSEIHTFGIAPVLFNGGKSPAIRVVINSNSRHFPDGMPDTFDFPDSEHFGYGVIGPQAELHGPAAEIPAADLLAPGEWYIWGWAEYDDIFGDTWRHRTEFCFQILRMTPPIKGQTWIGFRPTNRFNALDWDCLRPIDPA